MSKSKWEGKVGQLLDDTRFAWKHKCPDMPHAGQAKIDWVALDIGGLFWGIEVKYSDTQTLTPFKLLGPKGVSPMQRQVLNQLSQAGLAWLVIGHKGTNALYCWEWPWVEMFIQYEHRHRPDINLYLSSAARIITFPKGKQPEEYVRWTQLWKHPRVGHDLATYLSLSGSRIHIADGALSESPRAQTGAGSMTLMENKISSAL